MFVCRSTCKLTLWPVETGSLSWWQHCWVIKYSLSVSFLQTRISVCASQRLFVGAALSQVGLPGESSSLSSSVHRSETKNCFCLFYLRQFKISVSHYWSQCFFLWSTCESILLPVESASFFLSKPPSAIKHFQPLLKQLLVLERSISILCQGDNAHSFFQECPLFLKVWKESWCELFV